MRLLEAIGRTCDALQRLTWVRVLATLVVVGASAGFFVPILTVQITYEHRGQALSEVLSGPDGQTYGNALLATGAIEVDGRTYSAPREPLANLIEEDGTPRGGFGLVSLLLRDHIPGWMPHWLLIENETTWGLMFGSMAVGVAAIWLGLLVPVVGWLLLGGLLSGIMWLVGATSLVWPPLAGAALVIAFLLMMRVAMLGLARTVGWCAVAHTLLKEASRTRLALAFIVVLLIVLPLMPLTLDPESPLRHYIQAYLGRSLGFTFLLAAVMTITVSCSTVSFDQRDRHVWHLVTKPLDKFSYLLGKWLGVCVLSGVILLIAGGWIFGNVQYMRNIPVAPDKAGIEDQRAVDEEILVARASRLPVYEELSDADIRGQIDQYLVEDPAFVDYADGDVPRDVLKKLRARVLEEHDRSMRRVTTALDRAAEPWTRVHFEGLGEAKRLGLPVRLRFRLLGGRSDEHDRRMIGFAVGENDGVGVVGAFVPTMSQYLDLAPEGIEDDGTLDVTIYNLTHLEPPAGSDWVGPADLRQTAALPPVQEPFSLFWVADEVEMVYAVGGFDGNIVRAMLVLWVKLAVLAAMACALATFLSFPIACLAACTLFAGASIAPWLARALSMTLIENPAAVDWANPGHAISWVIEASIRTIARSMVYLLHTFGDYQPVDALVQGRLVSWREVGMSILRLGGLWGGLSLVVGWLILRTRQLAIYSGDQ